MTSKVGRLVARRIDDAHGYDASKPDRRVREVAQRMVAIVQAMNRDQMEACHAELNAFFRMVPFSEAIPVAVEIELKWPHHIETLPEANQRLDLIRKGGEYAMIFGPEKIENVLACLEEIEAGQ
ncbi:hypothetical protein BZL54_22970 [Burkholderia ubonensis subsp. mesacidophila]|uniref:Uncharacterized protein n=2 Tax=Burkholderia ubonensis TaxID=101571 RepID=A0A2A4FCG7_9BURK|nr:hypothetical protein BZL54_22970 [Burkholderia ubonensis subsp. mesacidophila]